MSQSPEEKLIRERNQLIKKSWKFLEPKMRAIKVYDIELRDFSRWLNRPENAELRLAKIKRGTMNPIFRNLRDWNRQLDAKQPVDALIQQVRDYREKFPAFADASKKYVAFKKDEEKRLKAEREARKELSPIANLEVEEQWYFYYIYPHEIKSILTIARCLLTIYKKGTGSKEEISASLENVKDSEDLLIGCYELIEGSKVRYYNLKNTSENRQLHFKVCKIGDHHDVLVGAYTTYDNKELYSGSLVLEKVPVNTSEKDKKPLEANPHEERKNYQHIPLYIQQYLGPRFENHNLVPPGIGTKEGIERWLEARPKHEVIQRMGRFFDSEMSKLFIAYPQSSYKEENDRYESDKEIIDKICDELEDPLEELNVEIVMKTKADAVEKKASSFMSLMELKTVKHFVLITAQHDLTSFSSVMLGWAMSHCMNIMIIYERESVSERYLALEKLSIKPLGIKSLKDDELLIKEEIYSFVQRATYD